MVRFLRSAGLAFTLCACAIVKPFAQTPPLVFTVAAPEQTPSETILRASAVVEERGLALWGGTASDFGVGVSLSAPRWTIRSIASMTTLSVGGHDRPTFQQIEIVRTLFSSGSLSVAGGAGIRQEWDGTRVFIGRLLAGSDVGPGRLQGSLVMERAVASPLRHDAADVVTSLGWSRRVGDRVSIGIEGIGQDLEGLWNPAEVDGGAKLLVGPSLRVQSKSGDWAASLTAGPVVHAPSVASPPDALVATYPNSGRHFGIFASASWVPSLHR
jgi:hypothetical protein